jgi:hypothetical protein
VVGGANNVHPSIQTHLNRISKMATKIGFLRDEFDRIGCVPPIDPYERRLYVGWHFTKILVCGLCEQTFDFGVLCEILKEIPNGAGEEAFWEAVKKTDLKALADKLNRSPLNVVT